MLNKIKYPLIILLFFVIGCLVYKDIFFVAYDVPRELLIPKGILEGKILYKDIYNFYGAIPYYIAALFFKLFGISVKSYFSLNAINSLVFIYGIYFLAREFITKKYAFLVTFFVMCSTLFQATAFSFICPYSICYTFALCAYVYSILFLVKFYKKNNDKYFIISSILAGFAVACKNEFILLPIIHLFTIFLYKSNKLKYCGYFILLFSIFPLFQILILLLSGLKIEDFIGILLIIVKNAQVPAMLDFHREIGMYPAFLTLKAIVLLFLFYSGLISGYFLYKRNKILAIILMIIMLFFVRYYDIALIFFFLPVLTSIILIWKFKKIIKRPALLILILGAILASLKTFFYLNFICQGAYVLPLLLVVWFTFLCLVRKRKVIKFFLTFFIMFFIFSSCIIFLNYTHKTSYKNFEFKTKEREYLVLNSITSWIENNTKKDDKILMFPEYSMPLLITNRKADYILYALHDINIQTLGDEYIKNRILNENYQYIIDTSLYASVLYCVESYKIINEGKYIETLLKGEFEKYQQITVSDNTITIYKKIAH